MSPQKEREKFDRVGFEFLIADLELGTTLARIAASSRNDAPKRRRNVQNARRAYEVVQRLAARAMLSETERIELDDKAAGLKSELVELGEAF